MNGDQTPARAVCRQHQQDRNFEGRQAKGRANFPGQPPNCGGSRANRTDHGCPDLVCILRKLSEKWIYTLWLNYNTYLPYHAVAGQRYRYGPDHPGAVFEATDKKAWVKPFLRMGYSPDGFSQGGFVLNQNTFKRPRKFYWQAITLDCGSESGTCTLGIDGFRVSGRYQHLVCRYFPDNALKNGLLPIIVDAENTPDAIRSGGRSTQCCIDR